MNNPYRLKIGKETYGVYGDASLGKYEDNHDWKGHNFPVLGVANYVLEGNLI